MDNIRKNEIMAVALFAASLFLFLSLFAFSEQDLSFYTSDPNILPRNITGVTGSYVGGVLLFIMGKAAYVIPLLILVWGVSRLLQVKGSKIFFKLFGTVFLVIAVSASLAMLADSSGTAAFSQGGIIGILASGFLLKYLGRGGAMLFVIAMMVLSMLVATEFLILPMLATVFKFGKRMFLRVRFVFPEKVFSRALMEISQKKKKQRTAREELAQKLDSMKKQVEKVRHTQLAGETGEKVTATSAPSFDPKIIAPKETVKVAPGMPRVTPVLDSATGKKIEYKLPGIDFLKSPVQTTGAGRDESLKARAALLERTLLEFGVETKVVKINRGPVITQYELEPALGTKVNRITSLGDNISLAMRSASVRIVAPLPGKGTIGVEIPNAKSELVLLKEVLEAEEYVEEESLLKIALGKDISGAPVVLDLAKMPHLLIAGATGSGKTVCINSIISGFLINSSPEEVKFLMVDPKRVELMVFKGIPHLISPIVTNPKKVAAALGWVVGEMERRYDIFAEKSVRNITVYKEKKQDDWEDLPYIVVVIDELADLMVVSQQNIEGAIMRLAQLSRAAGIHMILATQRPSVNVVTGVIKANFPARISFKVASKVDSRTVLDANGAEKLLGRGDMLVMQPGEADLIRGQCSLVEDKEIKAIVKFVRSQAEPRYIAETSENQETLTAGVRQEKDELYNEAVKVVIQTKQASVSMLQRKLRVGYTRAARMIDIMEAEGVVGPYNGAKPRKILIEDIEGMGSA